MKFLDPIDLRWIGPNEFQHITEVRCIPDDGPMITVPAGRKTDGCSIPKTLWPLMSPFGAWLPAAILHDFLYRDFIYRRERADQLFLETLLSSPGVNPKIAHLMYRGLRWFGKREKQDD